MAPVFDQDELEVYLPQGTWLDWNSGKILQGEKWVKCEKTLETIPIFIRENSMIPMLSRVPENIEEKYRNLQAIVFIKDKISEEFYDDGLKQSFQGEIKGDVFSVETDMELTGLTLYTERKITEVKINGRKGSLEKIEENSYFVY